jgi:hypothetical protein
MSDDYFDLIVWYEPSNAIHGFQLCYGKPRNERALTWLRDRGFMHNKIDTGEFGLMWGASPILVPDGSFPTAEVKREFEKRSGELPKALTRFVLAKISRYPDHETSRTLSVKARKDKEERRQGAGDHDEQEQNRECSDVSAACPGPLPVGALSDELELEDLGQLAGITLC